MTDFAGTKLQRVQILLDEKQLTLLKKLSDSTGLSVSKAIRIAVEKQRPEIEQTIKKARLEDAQSHSTKTELTLDQGTDSPAYQKWKDLL